MSKPFKPTVRRKPKLDVFVAKAREGTPPGHSHHNASLSFDLSKTHATTCVACRHDEAAHPDGGACRVVILRALPSKLAATEDIPALDDDAIETIPCTCTLFRPKIAPPSALHTYVKPLPLLIEEPFPPPGITQEIASKITTTWRTTWRTIANVHAGKEPKDE